ncbi:MAG: G5 domain-containing protein [Clostridiales bacterium]|nr:G5 domain-containing protein [Clostridiales bacterium]
MSNESRAATLRRITIYTVATVIAVLAVIAVFTSTVFAQSADDYNVIINDNGNELTVTTDETEAAEILNEAGITVNSNDIVDLSAFFAGSGGTISIDRQNTVYILYTSSGEIEEYKMYADTVADVLSALGEDAEGCILNYDLSAGVENGMVISIEHTMEITLTYQGESRSVETSSGTVEKAVELSGFELAADDYTEPSEDAELEDGMEIEIHSVETETVVETKEIKYDTETVKSDSLLKGETEVTTEGQNGEKAVTVEITYVDGKEESRQVISETVTKEAVTKVVTVGTASFDTTPNGVTSESGYTLGQTISGKYTHYCACSKCCGKSNGITASGLKVYNGMDDPHYVACNWLPLGSIIEIDGTEYLVADRGGSSLSRSGRVDIYTPAGHSAALRGGSGSCTITIVRLGW